MITLRARLLNLMEKIGYKFKNEKYLLEAITHSSYAHEHSYLGIKNNEKLEFLGDSVLDLITTEYLIETHKTFNEGELSKLKSQIISETVFSSISTEIGLGDYLYFSNGEIASGGKYRKSILGDAFEALIGAVFKDSDYYTTREVALNLLKNKIEHINEIEGVRDYKTDLQEYVQSKYKITPEYILVDTAGPDHDKIFKVNVIVNGQIRGEGIAKSKKEAEKSAAKNALENWE
ncbi:ribonuclease III [Caviibacter abscessus]|uniref:ribonuclease III n=1 Tax=Caviibacter abscessus TaxID=1766719 RepID=UPI0038B33526